MDMLGVDQKEGKMRITLKTIFGLEEVLAAELKELGFDHVELLNRAVRIEGTWKDVYYLNLHVRCAISVLVEIKKFRIKSEEDLYQRCMKINWTDYFALDKTFAVKGAVFSEIFSHSQYPFLVVKDAIADTFRKKYDERPNVNIKSPQVMFDVYIRNQDVTISLNTSGLPLFQRGYRESVGIAPLNEVVAAGLIRMSGWDKKSTFVDPFCGSGTLLIEAALMAAGLPPQIERTHFAFKNFANFQPEIWEEILSEVPKRITELPCKIIGSDISAEMVTKTRRNLRALPIGRFIETSVNAFQELSQVEGPGVMISNPPYGERMGEEIEEMYQELGDWMKGSMKGFECWVLSSNKEAFKSVGLRPERKIKVFNGDLECSFRKYSIYEGSKKAKYQNQDENDEPKEEFQGKAHEKEEWVKTVINKKREEKQSFEKKRSFDRKNEEARQGSSKPRGGKKYGDRRDRGSDSEYAPKKEYSPRKDKRDFSEKKDFSDKKEFSPEKKSFDRKPDDAYKPKRSSSKYEKRDRVEEGSKEATERPKTTPDAEKKSSEKSSKPISSYKNRSAKDKYGRKD
ncbi:MAG: hypothetical protein HWE22_13700 [Flavobacteriales bacterium]|nr:hypothetical protein [Flavobacteriales bacterium]